MSNQPTFTSRTPHFFRIILKDTLQENKLQIPYKFIRIYGETLSDSVSVKLPCGSEWKMKLKKRDGRVWLARGWPEFVKHYSISRGHLLIFRYEGNSKFCVFIFDTSTTEIDYPVVHVHFEGEFRVPKREDNEDDSIQILDDFSPSYKTREKSSLPCPRPPKRMKTDGSNYFSHSVHKGSHESKRVQNNSMSKENLETFKSRMKVESGLPGKSNKDKSTTTRQRKFDNMKPLTRAEKFAALKNARGFKSEQPFFKLVMQPSYVHGNRLTFPHAFARKYLKKPSNVILLKVRDGRRRTWTVKYKIKVCDRGIAARLQTGWNTFACDNNLKVGDVCVFVLLKGIPVSLEVIIFRFNGYQKPPMSAGVSGHEGRKVQVKQEESPTNDTESGGKINDETGMPGSCQNFPAKQASRCKSTFTSLKPKAIERQHGSLTGVEKTRILEKVVFESEKPFFKIVMQPSYAAGYKGQIGLPLDFAERYFKNEGRIILSVPTGRSWPVEYRIRRSKTGKSSPVLCSGWSAFADDNDLEVGDICIFELVNRRKISFQVSIFRLADHDTCCRHFQAGDSSTGGGKTKRRRRGLN